MRTPTESELAAYLQGQDALKARVNEAIENARRNRKSIEVAVRDALNCQTERLLAEVAMKKAEDRPTIREPDALVTAGMNASEIHSAGPDVVWKDEACAITEDDHVPSPSITQVAICALISAVMIVVFFMWAGSVASETAEVLEILK